MLPTTTSRRLVSAFFVAVREDCPTPDQWNRPWLQHRRRRGRSRGLRCRSTTPRATRSTVSPAPIARRRPPTIQSTRRSRRSSPAPASGDGTASTTHRGRAPGGRRDDRPVPPNHVAPDHAEETRAKYAEWALGYCGSRTTDRRLHPDQPAPTMTVSGRGSANSLSGRSPSTPGEPVDDVRRLTVREVARLQTFPIW